jgi:hypothetical protein
MPVTITPEIQSLIDEAVGKALADAANDLRCCDAMVENMLSALVLAQAERRTAKSA